jgi:2-oxoglutarate ferredoxin oxidoreductase subunit beta
MFAYHHYLRLPMFPHIWCPGCGDGIVLKALLRAIHKVGLAKDQVCMVSGIGCSSRLTGYVDFNTLHTTHGRPLPFATGIKMARPDLHVFVITGDGDAMAIGGNHFIHAARRNIGITTILFNNRIYGMTGGQLAPTTPEGAVASTARYGSIDPPFDPCRVAIACGASYVARGSSYHSQQLERLIEGGIRNPGFSLVEVVTNCNTYYGRPNKMSLTDLLRWEKDNSVNVKAAAQMTPEQLRGKFTVGVLHQEARPEYSALYADLVARVQGKAPARPAGEPKTDAGVEPGPAAAARSEAGEPSGDEEVPPPEEGLVGATTAEEQSGAARKKGAGA